MLLGALTATGAFVVLMLTDFQGIREFGFVSATAILMAFVSMITLFPALLALADRGRAGQRGRRPRRTRQFRGRRGSSGSPDTGRRSWPGRLA